MIAAAVSPVLMLAPLFAILPCRHEKSRDECTICVEETSEVLERVTKLQTCPGWLARRKAARSLRTYDWKCHPEAVEALADALLHDDHGLVRQAAAESLAKMKPCVPVAHEAVAKAAKCDTCLLARLSAKKALKAIGKSCVEDCEICGPIDPDSPDDSFLGEPRLGPIPMDSTVDPLPPAIRDVPGSESELSPFSPENPPPLAPRGSLRRAPLRSTQDDAPVLEMPLLPRANPTSSRSSSRSNSSRLERSSARTGSVREGGSRARAR
jgi:hypothetical protein